MPFEERITPLLVALAHDALDRGLYSYVEDLAAVLKALSSGRWRQLPSEEQLFWIRRLNARLCGREGLADILGYEHDLLNECTSVLQAQEKALETLA